MIVLNQFFGFRRPEAGSMKKQVYNASHQRIRVEE